jgi:hypothetical protein
VTVLLIRHRRICESRREGLTKENLGSLRTLRPFSLHGLSSKLEAMNEKSPARMRKALFSNKVIELSNLDLFKWILEFSEFIVVTSIIEGCGKS